MNLESPRRARHAARLLRIAPRGWRWMLPGLAGGLMLLPLASATADESIEVKLDAPPAASAPAGIEGEELIIDLMAGPADSNGVPASPSAPPRPIEDRLHPLTLESVMAPADPAQLLEYLKQDYFVPDSSLTLGEAIEIALKNNHDLNSQRLSAAAAVQDIKVNWTALRPQVGAQGKAFWQYSNVRPAQGDQETGLIENMALSITQRIYDFGLTNDLIDLAEARHAIQHFAVSTAEQQLVNDVTVAYLNYNLALGQSRIRWDELHLAEEVLRQANIQFEVGTAPRLDVIRAEARVETAHGGVIEASTNVGNAAAAFFALLGVEDKRYVPELVTQDYLQLGEPGPALDEAVQAALDHRPELLLQSSTLLAGQESRKLAKNRPVIEGFGNWQYTNPQPGNGGTYNTQWGVQIQWPVFTGGKDRVDRKKADLTIASISESLLDLEAKVELDATGAWNRLYAARNQAGVAQKNLELSGETLRAAYVGYQAGVTPYLDFADALDKNVAAAISYLIALAEVRLANIDLQRATGFPAGYPQDSRADFDPATPVETILGLPAQDATGSIAPAAAQ
jgi:outer membrane protein TolC